MARVKKNISPINKKNRAVAFIMPAILTVLPSLCLASVDMFYSDSGTSLSSADYILRSGGAIMGTTNAATAAAGASAFTLTFPSDAFHIYAGANIVNLSTFNAMIPKNAIIKFYGSSTITLPDTTWTAMGPYSFYLEGRNTVVGTANSLPGGSSTTAPLSIYGNGDAATSILQGPAGTLYCAMIVNKFLTLNAITTLSGTLGGKGVLDFGSVSSCTSTFDNSFGGLIQLGTATTMTNVPTDGQIRTQGNHLTILNHGTIGTLEMSAGGSSLTIPAKLIINLLDLTDIGIADTLTIIFGTNPNAITINQIAAGSVGKIVLIGGAIGAKFVVKKGSTMGGIDISGFIGTYTPAPL